MRLVFLSWILFFTGPAFSQFLPTLMIEPVTVSDPVAYAALVAKANQIMREQHKVPLFLRAYVSTSITGQTQPGFNLSPSASMAGIIANRETFARAPALAEIRAQINAITRPGPATYLKAIRFDGTNTPGWLGNTLVETDQEAVLLERVTLLKAALAVGPAEPPLINVFRVFAGAGPATHLVSINAASAVQLAQFLDILNSVPNPLNAPPITVLSTIPYEELSP